MKFSKEQKDLLIKIFDISQKGEYQPNSFLFEAVISKISPENCFINFAKPIGGFRIFIFNDDYKNDKSVYEINNQIITYLFLIDLLVENNLVIIYELKNPLSYFNIFISDSKNNEYINVRKGKPYISDSVFSPSFWKIIEKYGSTVITPSYSLIHLIKNDFKTDEEIIARSNLKKSTIAIVASFFAIFVSIIIGIISIILSCRMESISIESLKISRTGLDYTKKSATEVKQIELNYKLDSIANSLKNRSSATNKKK